MLILINCASLVNDPFHLSAKIRNIYRNNIYSNDLTFFCSKHSPNPSCDLSFPRLAWERTLRTLRVPESQHLVAPPVMLTRGRKASDMRVTTQSVVTSTKRFGGCFTRGLDNDGSAGGGQALQTSIFAGKRRSLCHRLFPAKVEV